MKNSLCAVVMINLKQIFSFICEHRSLEAGPQIISKQNLDKVSFFIQIRFILFFCTSSLSWINKLQKMKQKERKAQFVIKSKTGFSTCQIITVATIETSQIKIEKNYFIDVITR